MARDGRGICPREYPLAAAVAAQTSDLLACDQQYLFPPCDREVNICIFCGCVGQPVLLAIGQAGGAAFMLRGLYAKRLRNSTA
jgi:hypothetical protein